MYIGSEERFFSQLMLLNFTVTIKSMLVLCLNDTSASSHFNEIFQSLLDAMAAFVTTFGQRDIQQN